MRYEFHCRDCDHIWLEARPARCRDQSTRCPACQSIKAHRVRFGQGVKINSGKGSNIPGICHTLDKEPIHVKSKAHFRELCKARGVTPANI